MIGIIGAMDIEIDGLRAGLAQAVQYTIGGISFYTGLLGSHEVVLAKSGVGKVFAAMCAQTMILHFHPEYIINTGVAGALAEDLHIANLVIGTAAVQHDMDTSALGDPAGMISGINIVRIPADPTLSDRLADTAKALQIQTHRGIIASGDRFVASAQDKQRLCQAFQAIACEMEGGAVAQVCFVNGVPFALLRAVSDGAGDDSAMDYNTFARLAADQSVHLLSEFLK